MLILIFIILICIFGILAGFLSASETAITASSPLRLSHLAKKGNRAASILLSLQENMATLISAILVANIFLLYGITTLAAEIFRFYFGQIGLFIASLIMAGITALYVEILPKVYVYRCPENAALFLTPLLQFLRKFLFPMTLLMDKIAHFSLKMLGIQTDIQKRTMTVDDLRGAIDLHAGGGVISHERAMLRSILDLSRVSVSEVMVHRKSIVSFNIDMPFELLYEKVLAVPYTRVPLWRDSPDNIVGVIHIKNLVKTLRNPEFTPNDLQKIVKEPWFIPETSTLFHQMQLFKERYTHQAFVVDEYGCLLGMVTLEDILEEIVGEIKDEHNVELPGVRLTPEGSYLVRGCVTLRDLLRQYDWQFGEHSVSTIAGLVLHKYRSIPKVGTVIRIKDFDIKILRVHHHQITLMEVKPPTSHVSCNL